MFKHVTLLLLVASVALCNASGEDWVDYDEDDAGRNLAEMFSISGVSPSPASYGGGKGTGSGVYGGSGGPTPYGMRFPPPPAVPSSSPAASSPPQTAATASYSSSATVPGVQSTSTLTNYANVAAFNATERLRFTTTLESNIFKLLNALANVTIDSVVATSVSVTNTVAFTGADSTQASTAAAALVTALNSGDVSVFGSSFGAVTVSGVTATNATNPATKSGASSIQWTVISIVVAVIAVATVTLVGTSI